MYVWSSTVEWLAHPLHGAEDKVVLSVDSIKCYLYASIVQKDVIFKPPGINNLCQVEKVEGNKVWIFFGGGFPQNLVKGHTKIPLNLTASWDNNVAN